MAKQNRITLNGYFDTGDIPTQGQYRDLIESKLNLADTGIQIVPGTVSASFLEVENHITSSGNISASGNITASGLQIGSGIAISPTIISSVDRIEFSGNQARLDSTMNHLLIQGNDGDSTKGNLIVANITASGHIKTGGNLHLSASANGNITASGNISASGTIFGNDAQFGSSTVTINGLTGHITASGNISASGFVGAQSFALGPTAMFIRDDSITTNAGNIYFSKGIQVTGNITASGNLKIDGSQVDFTNLPTSDPGVAGRLYNDSGTVKISL